MRIRKRDVSDRPGIRADALVKLPIRASVSAVPFALIRRPIGHACRARARTIRQCTLTDSGGTVEAGTISKVVPIQHHVLRGLSRALRGSAFGTLQNHGDLVVALRVSPHIEWETLLSDVSRSTIVPERSVSNHAD